MPANRQVIYSYECGVCGEVYSFSDDDGARLMAEQCEATGTPIVHRLKVGQTVRAVTEDPNGRSTYASNSTWIEIKGCHFERKTHRPMYHVKFSEHSEHRNFPAENIRFRSMVYRWTDARMSPSGRVEVKASVSESMEPDDTAIYAD